MNSRDFFHRLRAVLTAALAGLLAAIPAAPARAAETLLDAARRIGFEQAEEYVPAEVLESFTLPSEEDWRRFWTGVQSALQSGDLEQLSWMYPEAVRGLEILDTIPGAESYADWFRQRLDYFDVADRVARRYPAPLPPPARPPAPPGAIVPPPPPKTAPPPPAVSRKREESVTSLELWKAKLKGRPAPARAGEFVPGLKRIFAAEGVPPELVWLAEVESSFNPEARSPVGARGLYQFMPATARGLGLAEGPPTIASIRGKAAGPPPTT
ncbi:MAG: transglycosylase SLT domain-containing protein [Candidatus Erginobacter occultus]|nr:transglycosylase SLT domain-containing protein [Candidatus Erginobacter occultus]